MIASALTDVGFGPGLEHGPAPRSVRDPTRTSRWSCGLTEEYEYECPMCEEPLAADAIVCPVCGLEFEPDIRGEEPLEGGGPTSSVPQDGDGPSEVEATLRVLTEMLIEDDAGELAPQEEPHPAAPPEAPRGGPPGGVLGVVGLVLLALAVLTAVGTVVMMNWDVWVQGDPKEVVGVRQRLWAYAGLLATVALGVGAVASAVRRWR